MSSEERHEVFDNISGADTLTVVGNMSNLDSASVDIKGSGTDTIRIDWDSVGRPTLIIWSRSSNFLGRFIDTNFSDINLTEFHSSAASQNTGTVDHIDQETKESTAEIHASLSVGRIIGNIFLFLISLYLVYILLINLWPHLKKLISSRLSNR